jgi:hypothetical protein
MAPAFADAESVLPFLYWVSAGGARAARLLQVGVVNGAMSLYDRDIQQDRVSGVRKRSRVERERVKDWSAQRS